VLASVLAVVLAMAVSISASFWTGVGCYAVAFAAFLLAGRSAMLNDRTLPDLQTMPYDCRAA
jgi:hypothetical protein